MVGCNFPLEGDELYLLSSHLVENLLTSEALLEPLFLFPPAASSLAQRALWCVSKSLLVVTPCLARSDFPLWSDLLDGEVRRLGGGSVERLAMTGSHGPKFGESDLLGPL